MQRFGRKEKVAQQQTATDSIERIPATVKFIQTPRPHITLDLENRKMYGSDPPYPLFELSFQRHESRMIFDAAIMRIPGSYGPEYYSREEMPMPNYIIETDLDDAKKIRIDGTRVHGDFIELPAKITIFSSRGIRDLETKLIFNESGFEEFKEKEPKEMFSIAVDKICDDFVVNISLWPEDAIGNAIGAFLEKTSLDLSAIESGVRKTAKPFGQLIRS